VTVAVGNPDCRVALFGHPFAGGIGIQSAGRLIGTCAAYGQQPKAQYCGQTLRSTGYCGQRHGSESLLKSNGLRSLATEIVETTANLAIVHCIHIPPVPNNVSEGVRSAFARNAACPKWLRNLIRRRRGRIDWGARAAGEDARQSPIEVEDAACRAC
jgi:hypothetical protein